MDEDEKNEKEDYQMIPLEITPDEYIKYHSPMPNYLFVLRRLENYEKVGYVVVPDKIREESRKFIPTGRILKISDFPSEDEYLEGIKNILRTKTYVGFEFHAIAPVHLMPQFKFPKGDDVVMLHVKDITIVDENLDELLERQLRWETQEVQRLEEEQKRIEAGMEAARQESRAWMDGKEIQKA